MTQVAVVGSGECSEGSEVWALAEEVGRRLAEASATVVCGGRGGAMEAVARGAATAGGDVIGILPWTETGEANPHCTHVVATGVGQARNLAVVASGRATIAIGGAWGTLSEIAHARNLGRPVVVLRGWSVSGPDELEGGPGVVAVSSPAEAVAAALDAA